jgi:hypothetical protein
MPLKRYVKTPLGEFATVQQAAAAHKCEKKTITNRIATRPEEYQYVQREAPARAKVVYERTVRGVRWPIGWNQYRVQDLEVKEQIYAKWCRSLGMDPNTEAAAEQFFDEMDQYAGDAETEETELAPDSDSSEPA